MTDDEPKTWDNDDDNSNEQQQQNKHNNQTEHGKEIEENDSGADGG